MVQLCRSRSESTRPRIGVRNAALPDVHVPIVIGGPLTPAHQQVRLRSRSKPVSLPGRLEPPPRRIGRDVHAAARHLSSGCP
jgi:hypothetical protein